MPVARTGQRPHHHLVRPPAAPEDSVVIDKGPERAPTVVELRIVPGDAGAARGLERAVVETGQVRPALERRRDGGQGDEEAGPEVGLEPIDQAHDARERHGLLDVEVQPVEVARAEQVPQGGVVGLEGGVAAVQPPEAALCGAAQHAEDADADVLHEGDFLPEGVVFGRVGGVVVEGDGGGGVVEVDGGDDEVGAGDEVGGFGEEGQQGDGAVAMVVGLVVED